MWNVKILALTVQNILAKFKFSKTLKVLVTRNTHVKYQSSSTHCSYVIRKVKVFNKYVYLQGHRVKNVGIHCKILPLEILMWKITSTSTHSSNVISKDKVFKYIGQIPRSRPLIKKCLFLRQDLVTRNTNEWYQVQVLNVQKLLARKESSKNW